MSSSSKAAPAPGIDINIDMRLNFEKGGPYYSDILMSGDEWQSVRDYITENLKILFDNDIKSMLDEYEFNIDLFKGKLINLLSKSTNVTCKLFCSLLNAGADDGNNEPFIKGLLTHALYDLVHDHQTAGRATSTHLVKCFQYSGSGPPQPINRFNSNQDAIPLSAHAHTDYCEARNLSEKIPPNEEHTDKRNKKHYCIKGILPPLFDVFDTGVVGCARKLMEKVSTLKVFASLCDPQGQGPDVGEHPDFDILFEMVLYNMSLLLTTSLFRTFNEHGIFLCASLPKKKSEPGRKREDWLKDPSNYVLRVMRNKKTVKGGHAQSGGADPSKIYVSDDINIPVGGGGKCPFSVPGIAKDLSNTLPVYLKKGFIFEWDKMSNIWRSLLDNPDQKISLLDFIEKLEEDDVLYSKVISILRDLYYANKMHGDSGQLTLALFLSELSEYFKYNEKSKIYEFVENIMYKNKVSARSKDTWAGGIMTVLKGPITIGTDDDKFQYTTANPYAKFDGIDKFASWPFVSSNGALLLLDEEASVKKDEEDETRRKEKIEEKIESVLEQEQQFQQKSTAFKELKKHVSEKKIEELVKTQQKKIDEFESTQQEFDKLKTDFDRVKTALQIEVDKLKGTTSYDSEKIIKLEENITAAKKVIDKFSQYAPDFGRKRTPDGDMINTNYNDSLKAVVRKLQSGDYNNDDLKFIEETIRLASTDVEETVRARAILRVKREKAAAATTAATAATAASTATAAAAATPEAGAGAAAAATPVAVVAEKEEAGSAKKKQDRGIDSSGSSDNILVGGRKNFNYEYLSDSSYDSDISEKSHENIFYNYLIKKELKGGLSSFGDGALYYKATSDDIKSTLKSTKVHNKSIDELLAFSKFAKVQLNPASFDKYISINEIVKRAKQLAKYDKDCLLHIKSNNMVLKELEKRENDMKRIYDTYKRDKSNKTFSMFKEREEAIKKLNETEKTDNEKVFSEISKKHFKMDKDNTDYEPRDIFTGYQKEESEPKKLEEKIEEKLAELRKAEITETEDAMGDEKEAEMQKVIMAQLPTIKYNKEWNILIELLKEQMQTNIPVSMVDNSNFAFLSSLKENITHALVILIQSAASNVSLAQLEPIYNSVLIFMQHVSPIIHKTGKDSASKKYYYELSLCLNGKFIKFMVEDEDKETQQAHAQNTGIADSDMADVATAAATTAATAAAATAAASPTPATAAATAEASAAEQIASNDGIFNPFKRFDAETKKDEIKTFFENTKIQHLNKLFGLITTTTAFFMIYSLNIIRLLYSNIEHDFINIVDPDKAKEKKDYEIMIINAKELLSSYLHNTGVDGFNFDTLESLKTTLIDSDESTAFKILYYKILQKNSFSELADSQPKHNKTLRLFSTKLSSIIKKASQLKKFLVDGLIKVEELINSYNEYKSSLPFDFESDSDKGIFDSYIIGTIPELQKIKVEILIEIELLINLLNKLKEKSYELVYGLLTTESDTGASFDKCIDDLYELNNLINTPSNESKSEALKNVIKSKNKLAGKVCDILHNMKLKKPIAAPDYVEYDLEPFEHSDEVSKFISQYDEPKTYEEKSVRLYYGSLYNTDKIIKEWHIKNLSLYIELRNKVIKTRLYDITMLETIFDAVFNVFNENNVIAKEALNKALLDLINAIKEGLITNYIKTRLSDNKAFADILYQTLLEIKKIALKLEKKRKSIPEDKLDKNTDEKLDEMRKIKRYIELRMSEEFPKLFEEDQEMEEADKAELKSNLIEEARKIEVEETEAAAEAKAEAEAAAEAKAEAKTEEQLINNIDYFLPIISIELKILNPLKQLDIFKEAWKFYNKGFTKKETAELDTAKKAAAEKKGKCPKLDFKCKKLQEKHKKMDAAEKKIKRFEKFEIFKDDPVEYPNKNESFIIFMKEKMEYLNILFEILCNNKNISSLIKSLKNDEVDDKTNLKYLAFGSEKILDKDSGTFVDI